MKGQHPGEYCLVVEGSYLSVNEAEHALRDPFIEDLVEQTGRFRIHNLNEMMIVPGVALGQLGIEMIEEGVFRIYSLDPEKPLTERKAEGIAEALRRQDMFDEMEVEPRWLNIEDESEDSDEAETGGVESVEVESDEVESE
ncbi:MAG: hypothetical protein QOH51_2739 [Acidobacteriota bacterium]|jgi:hypothetical protein|nr:hypothetical protein [Acidobacteriota bacterium]